MYHKEMAALVALASLTMAACSAEIGEATPSPTEAPAATQTLTPEPSPTAAVTQPPDAIEALTDAPTFGETPSTRLLFADGAVTAIAPWGYDLLLGTSEGPYALSGDTISAVPAFDAEAHDAVVGPVHAIAPRGEGLIIAAEGGVFTTQEWALVYSPLGEAVSDLSVVDLAVSGEGGDEAVWVAAADGLYVNNAEGLFRVGFEGVTGGPVAVAAGGGVVAVAYHDGVIALNAASLSYELGPIAEVWAVEVQGDGRIWAASEAGLFSSEGDGAWRHHLLGPTAHIATALGLSASGDLLAATDLGIISFIDGKLAGIAQGDLGATAIGEDIIGDVWVAAGAQLTALEVGTPVSFAEAISPIFAGRCGYCHLEGTLAPKHDFSRYEEVEPIASDVLTRVLSGQMPSDAPLSEDQLKQVELWAATGLSP